MHYNRNGFPVEVRTYRKEPTFWDKARFYVCAILISTLIMLAIFLTSCSRRAWADEPQLKASWYSVESLKKEGTWKTSKGVMANGKQFKDGDATCATRLFKLDELLRITNVRNGKSVVVRVTDRIGKRFANTRIDLSRSAFSQIADLKEGIIPIEVEVLNV